jgi:hypothetical protein
LCCSYLRGSRRECGRHCAALTAEIHEAGAIRARRRLHNLTLLHTLETGMPELVEKITTKSAEVQAGFL